MAQAVSNDTTTATADQTRRLFPFNTAGIAAGGAGLAAAVNVSTIAATRPAVANDPIFAAIEDHRSD